MAHPIRFVKNLVYHNYIYHVAKPVDLHALAKSDWGAVTGCTHGIGRAYAEEMAKKNFNVLLIGRTPIKLEKTRSELAAKYPKVKFEVAEIDFCTPSEVEYEKKLKGPLEKVGFLVNNVGHVAPYPDKILDIPNGMRDASTTVLVNAHSMAMMCHLAVGHMVKRNGGIIVNVSSSAGELPFPMWTLYSATKKFTTHYTKSLRREYPQIFFQNLIPGWVQTEMSRLRQRAWNVATTDEYAASAINTVGLAEETRGNWRCQLHFDLFLDLFPEFMVQKAWAQAMEAKKQENILYDQEKAQGIRQPTK
ncbi:unnamed protein product [Bursaphelenchus xylophilus]|uniref:(pine wood nematode) hypothetical protein n=1 Tax=Bursaphelenchus xylophilus TaxID=6326 RepID=A0A1I7S5D3_BURXY|nr:unnamed protein product [Bursaphelenchus xylophilus]CAG9117948.1 unnamed protein product [Bursaphelenchus xylophilus]